MKDAGQLFCEVALLASRYTSFHVRGHVMSHWRNSFVLPINLWPSSNCKLNQLSLSSQLAFQTETLYAPLAPPFEDLEGSR
jgi:hypothetical protein